MIFHLAGVNRPQNPIDFETGNAGLTEQICQFLREGGRSPKIVFSSSIQAELDNPYGASKAKAEKALQTICLGDRSLCSNLPPEEPVREVVPPQLQLSHRNLLPQHRKRSADCNLRSGPRSGVELRGRCSGGVSGGNRWTAGLERGGAEIPSYRIQLGDLAGRIQAFHEMRTTLTLPDFADWFNRALYATYLSYVPPAARGHNLDIKSDARGSLAEFIKEKHFGQIFVSRTKPGVTRGNHYHHTKTEKFFVVEGDGLIRMRAVEGGPVEEYSVTGSAYQVIDIPPGFTHSITNRWHGRNGDPVLVE